jgi:hypothetical protein
MRYMLTLATVHDDDHDAADIEAATDDMWGQVYLADGSPVEFVTVAAAVLDDAAMADTLAALAVGSDGADAAELVAGVAETLRAAWKATR